MITHRPGSRISDRYEVAGRPLSGGMGIVYFCHDLLEDRPVALKTFKPEYIESRKARDNFLKEATLWIGLGSHPHIVRAYLVLSSGDGVEVYIVLELVAKPAFHENASLRGWLLRGRPLPQDEALLYALQVARGMRHAVEKRPGFVHRDLKPENLLVGDDRLPGWNVNRLRITDFGLAGVLERAGVEVAGESSSELIQRRTIVGQGVCGTAPYMAPEQWRGEASLRSDMYALGCILFEMLVGEPPVTGATRDDFKRAHCEGMLGVLPRSLSGVVRDVVARCLGLDPSSRYMSWAELELALRKAYRTIRGGEVPEPEPPGAIERADRVAMGWSYSEIGGSYIRIGKAKVAVSYFEKAREIAKREDEPQLEGQILVNLGAAHSSLGNPRCAVEYGERASALARKIRFGKLEAQALANVGCAHGQMGDLGSAISYLEKASAMVREVSDPRSEAQILNLLGVVHRSHGHLPRAIEILEQALGLSRRIGSRSGEASCQHHLGTAYRSLGQPKRAIELHQLSRTIALDIGDPNIESDAILGLGVAWSDLGHFDRAIGYYKTALAIAEETGDRRAEGKTMSNIGEAYRNLGDARNATAYLEKGLEVARETGDKEGEGAALGALGNVYLGTPGRARRAVEFHEKCLAIQREIGHRQGEGKALASLGTGYLLLNEPDRAIEYLQKGMEVSNEVGDVVGAARTACNLATALDGVGQRRMALSLLEQALSVFRRERCEAEASAVQQVLDEFSGGLN